MSAFDQLLRRLVEARARFVLIGGLALGAMGVVRGTKDIDVVVDPDPANLKVVAEVAVASGGHVQRGEALLGTPFSIAAALAEDEQVAIETRLGRLDVVQGLEGVPAYAELRARSSEAEVLGVKVAVCSAGGGGREAWRGRPLPRERALRWSRERVAAPPRAPGRG